MAKLWESGSSRKEKPDASTAGSAGSVRQQVEAFTVDNDYLLDQKLLPYDIRASKVHAAALKQAGLLAEPEFQKLASGLDEIAELHAQGKFEILPEHEDGHTAIELRLTEKLGDLGKKIHTGRSRNDQVLTAVRLYEADRLETVLGELAGCAGRLLKLGRENSSLVMPGYTHTRKAMLSSVAQWAAGYAELLIMQLEASAGCKALIGSSPLGTAAGFGSTLPIDRETEAEELGFERPMASAATAQLSRGWVEWQLSVYLSAITLVLSRLADDIIRFSDDAYGFFKLDAAVCTGSSIMPQKKNPDVAELIRGRHAVTEGCAATLQSLVRNLGSGYHRDLQLTKEPVMKAFETTFETLRASSLLLDHLSFDSEKLEAACTPELQAAEAAYKLVREDGLTFRDAYRKIKEDLASGNMKSVELTLDDYRQLGSPGNPGLDLLEERLEAIEKQRIAKR